MRPATRNRRGVRAFVVMALAMTLGQWVLMLFPLQLLDRLLISGGVALLLLAIWSAMTARRHTPASSRNDTRNPS